jgi:hypothetical protein
MKHLLKISAFLVLISLFLFACTKDDNTGELTLSITDAPIDNTDIEGVYLTVTDIQYHKNDSDWTSFEGFNGPQLFNILELTEGESAMMGTFSLEAGHYTQLRFFVDAPEENVSNPVNPGCYITFKDDSEEPLFVPSGSVSGWKGVGAFDVPLNGTVEITADFDARKSIFISGAGRYILVPTIRLIVDNEAGQIAGGVSNLPVEGDIIIYAYEDGTYSGSESDEPLDEMTPRFENAVTSDIVDDDSGYKLAFLAPKTYDLIVTLSVDGGFQEVLGIVEDVDVESNKTTNQPIDIFSL